MNPITGYYSPSTNVPATVGMLEQGREGVGAIRNIYYYDYLSGTGAPTENYGEPRTATFRFKEPAPGTGTTDFVVSAAHGSPIPLPWPNEIGKGAEPYQTIAPNVGFMGWIKQENGADAAMLPAGTMWLMQENEVFVAVYDLLPTTADHIEIIGVSKGFIEPDQTVWTLPVMPGGVTPLSAGPVTLQFKVVDATGADVDPLKCAIQWDRTGIMADITGAGAVKTITIAQSTALVSLRYPLNLLIFVEGNLVAKSIAVVSGTAFDQREPGSGNAIPPFPPYPPTTPATLSSIAITTAPSKVSYTAGEALDLAGMVVTATYSDGSTAAVTSYTTAPAAGATLAATDTAVTVTYAEGGVTKTATQAITVA